MANNLTQIQALQNAVLQLENEFQGVNNTILDISKNLRSVGSNISNVRFTSDISQQSRASAEELQRLNNVLTEQTKTIANLEQRLAQLSQARARGNRASSEEIVNNRVLRQNADNYARSLSSLVGAYGNLSAENNLLIREYQNLSVQQRRNNDLTQEQVQRLSQLSQTITNNQQILKQTDAEVGRFQRNVGNYSSAFDGLGNALNNITREFPAFAVSAQTGILAISNNLPILFDEISRLRESNRTLAAQGEQTTSVLRQLGKSFFSLSSILSIGVAVFTIYGKEIGNLVGQLFQTITRTDANTEAQNRLNAAYSEGAKQVSTQVAQNQLLLTVAADVTRSTTERNLAVDNLIDSSQGLITEQDRLNILNGEAEEIERRLTQTLVNRATVQAVLATTQEDFGKIVANNVLLQEAQEERARTISDVDREVLAQLRDGISLENVRIRVRGTAANTTRLLTEAERENIEAIRENIRAGEQGSFNTRRANQLDQFRAELIEKNARLQERINALIKASSGLVNEDTLRIDNNTGARERNARATTIQIRTIEEQVEAQRKLAQATIEVLRELNNVEGAGFEIPELDQDSIERFRQSLDENITQNLISALDRETLNTAIDGLFGEIQNFTGVSSRTLRTFFDQISDIGTDSFEDIANSAVTAFDIIGQASQQISRGRIEQLELQLERDNEYYENLLENEELTESERQRLEADRAANEEQIRARQRQEQVRQARFDKAINIATIIARTAVGVASALPNIPLSILVGSIGAAQLAIALAQPIPQFAEGKNFNDDYEGPAIWGEKRREVKLSSDGSIEVSPRNIANHLTHVKKDDVIFPSIRDANNYFASLSYDEITADLNRHTFLANMHSQNVATEKFMTLQAMLNNSRRDTRQIVDAIKSKRTQFRVQNNVNLADDLKYLKRSKNIL